MLRAMQCARRSACANEIRSLAVPRFSPRRAALIHTSAAPRLAAPASSSSSSSSPTGVSADDEDSHDDFKPKIKVKAAAPPAAAAAPGQTDYAALVQKQVKSNGVFLYMKGSPDAPRCGFSRQVVMILRSHKVDFAHCDITENDYAICDAVEKFSEWPTYPQLFVSGELVGGCDIVTDLHRSGELTDTLKAAKAVAPATL